MQIKERDNLTYDTKLIELLRIQLEKQSKEHNEKNPECHVGAAYICTNEHKNIQGKSLNRETLAYKHMESLEQILNIRTTIGGHPLVTAQNVGHGYITRDPQIGERFTYTYSGTKDIIENLRNQEMIITPFLDEEEQK